MIHIKNLSKSYGSKKVLDNISLDIEKGKVCGIVGENGAGKTTLFMCLAGLETFQGQVIYKEGSLKDVLGLLTTDPFFFAKITGREYLQLLCNARNIKHSNFDDSNIFDLPLDQYAETYSTGMKKKLALTGILLQKNEVFIFDEPFNGVDIGSNILISEIILKLKELRKTIIISSHIFSTLSATCDQLHLLKNGAVIRTAGSEEFKEIEDQMRNVMVTGKIERILGEL